MTPIVPRRYVPLPYQPQMEQHLRDNPWSLLLVEMGLGKTVVVLKDIDEKLTNGSSRGVLIIAPLRVSRITWPEQCETWEHSAWMRVVNMNTPEGAQAWEEGSADVYLTHYDVLATREVHTKCRTCKGMDIGCGKCVEGYVTNIYPGFVDKFLKGRKTLPVDHIVYDEISVFKDPSGKRAAAVRPYLPHFKFRTGMTGTPLGNSRLNLFNQVRMVDGGQRLGHSFFGFRQTYAESDYMGYKWTMKEGASEIIDRKISDISLVLLNEDHADLPPCFHEDIEVTLPTQAEEQYRKIEKELLLQLEKGEIVALNNAVLANKMLQITGGAVYDENRAVHELHTAKIDALKKLRKKLGAKEPLIVLVAFQHESKRVLDAIPGSRMFNEKDLNEWRAGRIHTWVVDARSISHGIDGLQMSCCNMVFFTPYWSAETVQQVIKRIHRRGNSRDTWIWRLVAKIKGKISLDEIVIESNRANTNEQTGMFQSLKNLQRIQES